MKKKVLLLALVFICITALAVLTVSASDTALASQISTGGEADAFEPYAILVIVIAAVVSSVAYIFLRRPKEKKEEKKEEESE